MSHIPLVYLDIEDILRIRIRFKLGAIRDVGLLESAVHRPQSLIFGNEAYIGLTMKAAALLHSLVKNHSLFDGNKRLAWTATAVFLAANGQRLETTTDEGVEFMLASARGDLDLDGIAAWIDQHLRRLND